MVYIIYILLTKLKSVGMCQQRYTSFSRSILFSGARFFLIKYLNNNSMTSQNLEMSHFEITIEQLPKYMQVPCNCWSLMLLYKREGANYNKPNVWESWECRCRN